MVLIASAKRPHRHRNRLILLFLDMILLMQSDLFGIFWFFSLSPWHLTQPLPILKSLLPQPMCLTSHLHYVNVNLPIGKLDGMNYATWPLDVKLWLGSQRYLDDHLTQKVIHICIVLKNTIQSSLKQMFQAYDTCSKVWE